MLLIIISLLIFVQQVEAEEEEDREAEYPKPQGIQIFAQVQSYLDVIVDVGVD